MSFDEWLFISAHKRRQLRISGRRPPNWALSMPGLYRVTCWGSAGAEARTDHHKDILSIVNTDWGLYAGCDPGKCVSLPPSNATHGDTLHIKCAGDHSGWEHLSDCQEGRGFVTKSPHPVSPGGKIIKILFTSPSPLYWCHFLFISDQNHSQSNSHPFPSARSTHFKTVEDFSQYPGADKYIAFNSQTKTSSVVDHNSEKECDWLNTFCPPV